MSWLEALKCSKKLCKTPDYFRKAYVLREMVFVLTKTF